MKKLGLNDIRKAFLDYFASKEHMILPSASLVPQGDTSLLTTNSGMQPLKPYFAGTLTPPSQRLASCQRCLRNTDILRVGETARHGTYFEMLGNFSIADYFKREAITYAWEFCTEVLEIDKSKLYATVYLDDDEAHGLWLECTDIDPTHVSRLGKADNFWEIGDGPCGPSSEIYYDWGEEHSCGSPDCKVGCDCDRYVEFWNLVFTQFDRAGDVYTPLARKNIDTGMGLERLTCMSQGVRTLFEVDTIASILDHVARIAHVAFHTDRESDRSLLIITDHLRGCVNLIADGVAPSNEGTGYVLRRMLRRAVQHGGRLGIHRAFMAEVADTVIDQSCDAYPHLGEKRDYIKRILSAEEEAFDRTVQGGMNLLEGLIADSKGGVFSGAEAFKLYDTYGFPIDLTIEILKERGMSVDMDGYNAAMDEQRKRSRASVKGVGWDDSGTALDVPATVFVGYETLCSDATVLYIKAADGDTAQIILDTTPFYAESGGQVGDAGVITCGDTVVRVSHTTKHDGRYIHHGEVVSGTLQVGDRVTASVDAGKRLATAQNHTAAHLLQRALRDVLGSHVSQAGSYVSPELLRFDFTHYAALTPEETMQVEDAVNNAILAAYPIHIEEMDMESARAKGAIALFNEKYGNSVRVVDMGGYSVELCGGTHLDNTSKVGLFKILSESSISSGTRRIEAHTSVRIIDDTRRFAHMISQIAEQMKTTPAELGERVFSMMNNLRLFKEEAQALRVQMANLRVDELLRDSALIKGVTLIAARIDHMDRDALRTLGDALRDKSKDCCILLSSVSDGKIELIATATKSAVARGIHCGKLISAVAKHTGGGGGGKPDFAAAGGKDASKLDEAMALASAVVDEQVK